MATSTVMRPKLTLLFRVRGVSLPRLDAQEQAMV